MKDIIIYTDGACSGNPGVGGYCAILLYKDYEKIISGYEESTTNNRMELKSVIAGLEALKEPCNVQLYSDSNYVVEAFNKEWIINWQKNGWKNSNNKQVKNIDLWVRLLELQKKHKITFIKVKGHSENDYNNKCDKIAVSEYKKYLKL